ncbi:MAG: GNAT family N-acetyltransferase [Thermoplasmata archaeon]
MSADLPAAGVRIRRVDRSEWESYREIRLRALAHDPWAFGSTVAREREFTSEQWMERIARDPPDSSAACWAAVEPSGQFVGIVGSGRFEGAFHIFAMWVAPEWRRQRIAGLLLDAALVWVQAAAPGNAVYLDVNRRANAAVSLYESRRFRATGKVAPLGHIPGEQIQEMTRAG